MLVKFRDDAAGGVGLAFVAEAEGASDYRLTGLQLSLGADVVAKGRLGQPVAIPASLTRATVPPGADRTLDGPALRQAGAELLRRMAHAEATWDGTFCGAARFGGGAASLSGEFRMHAAALWGEPGSDVATLRVRTTYGKAVGGTTVHLAYAFSVTVTAAWAATLSLDLDDLGISLPPLPFPGLSFAVPALPLDLGVPGAARAIAALLGTAVGVTVTGPAGAGLTLALDGAGRLTWQLSAGLVATIAILGTRLATVTVIAAGDDGTGPRVEGAVVPGTAAIIPAGSAALGPLRLEWEAAPLAVAIPVPATVITAAVDVVRLTMFAESDPAARISVAGRLHLTPSHVLVERLALLEPDQLELVSTLTSQATRVESGTLRIVTAVAARTAEALARLLDALARIGAGVARAAGLVTGSPFVELAGLARPLGDALRAVAALADGTGPITVEVRASLDPLSLRQVRVGLPSRTEARTLRAAGLSLGIEAGWQPGLLADFDKKPGFDLLATMRQATGGPVSLATLSTDLWLTEDGQASPVRDGSEEGRATPRKPLLSLAFDHDATRGEPLILAVAGLSAGRPVLLKRLAADLAVSPLAGGDLAVGDGYRLEDLGGLTFTLSCEAGRLLPLLGAELPAFPDQLESFRQVIRVIGVKGEERGRVVVLHLDLGLKAVGLETMFTLDVDLSLDTLQASVHGGSSLSIRGKAFRNTAMGLVWVVKPASPDSHDVGALFEMSFAAGEQSLALARDAKIELHLPGVAADGAGLIFDVTAFRLGRGGLTLDAGIRDTPVTLNGLDQPFRFTSGGLSIADGALRQASITGIGRLPPALVGTVSATVSITFTAGKDGTIAVQSATGDFERAGGLAACHGTRFSLTLSKLGFTFVHDGDAAHFYFLLTGSARFTPLPGEFGDGLLQYLPGIEIDLDRVPIAADARVLARHISFQVPMHPPKHFDLFGLFTFEVRGIGFHPSSDAFDGDPAMNISGQITFHGSDVVQASIDFHGLLIAPPAPGTVLPRIRCDQLTVDLQLSGTARIAGSVAAVDGSMASLQAPRDLTPDGYKVFGFLGSGSVSIDGFGSMAASLGFVTVERRDQPGERKRAFFMYLERDRVAYKIVTPIAPMFLREVGFGFGYRYTLEGIRRATAATSTSDLIAALDDVSRRQGELAKFTAWMPDPEEDGEPARITLALRGALTLTTASSEESYDGDKEKALPNPFLFDIILALRSDMTLLVSMRGWLAVNYADWLDARDEIRQNPGYRGYLFISAPRQEFLGRFIADPAGYVGNHPPVPPIIRSALKSVAWSATLLIRPGLFQFELGWPDQLWVQLSDKPEAKIRVAGGMVFRITDGAVLQGFNVLASASFHFGGSYDGGWVGAAVDASLATDFTACMIACIDTRRSSDTLFYGLFALHASLEFRVSAWMRIDLWIGSITVRIGFGVSIQLSAAVELAVGGEGLGARVNARVSVGVFGCSLGLSVGFAFGSGFLDTARSQVQRFLSAGLTAATPDPEKALMAGTRDNQVKADAAHADQATAVAAQNTGPAVSPPDAQGAVTRTWFKDGTDPKLDAGPFWLVLRTAEALPAKLGKAAPASWYYAFLLPKDGVEFYAAPPAGTIVRPSGTATPPGAGPDDHVIHLAEGVTGLRFDPISGRWVEATGRCATAVDWAGPPGVKDAPAIGWLLAQCFLWQASSGTDQALTLLDYRNPAYLPHVTADDPKPDERKRASGQRGLATLTAAERPAVTAARDARALLLAQFAQDLRAAASSPPGAGTVSLAASMGLLLLLPATAFVHGAALPVKGFEKRVGGTLLPCDLDLLQHPDNSFVCRGVTLAGMRSEGAEAGIHLGWQLTPGGFDAAPGLTDDHYLDHVKVVRAVDIPGVLERVVLAKPVATLGASEDGTAVHAVPPKWQFTDDLADLGGALRRAILGSRDPDRAPDIVKDWHRSVGGGNCRIRYTVTPVDSLGTRGPAHSIVHVVRQPAPPIRPAAATLVIEVAGMVRAGQWRHDRPDNVRVVLGVADAHWKEDRGGLARSYELVCEADRIQPSGFYASDGLTGRIHPTTTAGTEEPGAQPPGRIFAFTRRDMLRHMLPATDPGQVQLGLFSPPDDLGKTAVWAALAVPTRFTGATGQPVPLTAVAGSDAAVAAAGNGAALLDALWADGSGRIANRFKLRTVTTLDGVRQPLVSAPAPVTLEVRLVAELGGQANPLAITALRPESFEWPVALPFPPLGPGQVEARTGLATIRMPQPGMTLQAWLASRRLVDELRDPERRVLTELSFDAVHPAMTTHEAACLAGFDVLEADLDTAAPSEMPAAPLHVQYDLWDRAKTLSRVQLLPPGEAAMTPASLADLVRWRAYYPSTAWRHRNGAPVSAFYTRAESTPLWPAPMPRHRLLPGPDEAVVNGLFASGTPVAIRIDISLDFSGPAAAAARKLKSALLADGPALVALQCGDTRLATGFEITAGEPLSWEAAVPGRTMLSPALVREMLLRLAWAADWPRATDKREALLDLLEQSSPVGLALTPVKVDGSGGAPVAVRVTAAGILHPVLEEALGTLALEPDATTGFYTRYSVETDPAPRNEAADAATFLRKTGAAQDPYGWGVLQQLGLAASFRLYDLDAEAFLPPDILLPRVQAVFDDTVGRYGGAAGRLGQPFAEVLLRPGKDRGMVPFDGRSAPGVTCLSLVDDALATLQISLRPSIAATQKYADYDVVCDIVSPALRLEATFREAACYIWGGGTTAREVCAGAAADVGLDRTARPLPATGEPDPALRLRLRSNSGAKPEFRMFDSGSELPEGSFEVSERKPGLPMGGPDGMFGRFPNLTAKALLAALLTASKEAMASWDSFDHWMRRRGPGLTVKHLPATEAEALAGLYGGWSERFMDHGAAPEPPADQALFALAAQERPQPWRTAVGADGRVSVSFLHADRWGHARAYAVRPLGRWLRLEEALRPVPVPSLRALGSPPVGYAVAVTRRTERLAAPVLLKREPDLDPTVPPPAWLVGFAPHPEAGLAASNRTVSGRLDYGGMVRGFIRIPRNPGWAAKMADWHVPPPTPERLPASPGARPSIGEAAFTADELVEAGRRFPSLRAAGDLYRYRNLPYYFHATILAAARAGIATSPLSSLTFGDFQFQVPEAKADLRVDIGEDGAGRLKLTVRLLRYRDCLPPEAERIWAGGPGSYADLPDPEVTYIVAVLQPAAAVREDEAELRFAGLNSGWSDVARWQGHRFGGAMPDSVIGGKLPDMSWSLAMPRRRRSVAVPLAGDARRLVFDPAAVNRAAFRQAIAAGVNAAAAVPDAQLFALCQAAAELDACYPSLAAPVSLVFRWTGPAPDFTPIGVVDAPPGLAAPDALAVGTDRRGTEAMLAVEALIGVSPFVTDRLRAYARDLTAGAPSAPNGLPPEPVPLADITVLQPWDASWTPWAALLQTWRLTVTGTDAAGLAAFRTALAAAIAALSAGPDSWDTTPALALASRVAALSDAALTSPGARWSSVGALPQGFRLPWPLEATSVQGPRLWLIDVAPPAPLAAMAGRLADAADRTALRDAAVRMLLDAPADATLELRAIRGAAPPARTILPPPYS